MKFFAFVCALGAQLVVTSSAQADVLYTAFARGGSDRLATIDTSTGLVTEIGAMGLLGIQSIAWDSSSATLYGYAINEGRLVTIDPTTAAVTLVGAQTFGFITGLTYDPLRDTLFAAGDGGPSTSQVYDVNRISGALAATGALIDGGNSLEFFPQNGDLLFAGAFPGSLGTFDPDGGSSTIIGPADRVGGLEWSTVDNALYGTSNFGNVESNLLYTIDPATGATINTITLSQTEFYAALTAIPAPGGVMLFGCVGGAVGSRRRRARRPPHQDQ